MHAREGQGWITQSLQIPAFCDPVASASCSRLARALRPGDLQLAVDRARQQVGVAARRPNEHGRGLAGSLRLELYPPVLSLEPDRAHRAVAAPLELLGEPDNPGEEREP